MNISDLNYDILSLIEDEVKNHPKYKFKKVIQEIELKKDELCSSLNWVGIDELINAPPYTTATHYSWDNGGFWFDPCNDTGINNETWILKEYNDGLYEHAYLGLPHPITNQPLVLGQVLLSLA